MGIKEGVLALADELEAFEDGDCEECSLYGQPECKGHLSCMEIMARYAARKMREAVERDAEDVTTVSAYDLLPEDEREAIAWVRAYGGLDAVKAFVRQAEMEHGYLLKIAHALGTSIYDGSDNADALLEKLSERLMPEGMEWPTVDGEPIVIGERMRSCGIEDCKVVGIDPANARLFLAFNDIEKGKAVYFPDLAKDCHRPAPKVLDADGVEICVGDRLYDTDTGCGRTVRAVNDNGTVEFDGHENRGWFGCFLTHRAPVLAADGRPLREGEHVYHVETGAELVVKRLPNPGEYQAVVVFALPTSPASHLTSFDPDQLTHQRPVLDADGVEVHKGDEVWSTTGEFDGKRTVSSVHIDPDEPPYATFEERQKPYSCLCCYLIHRAPVIAADGEPLEVGQTVWDVGNGVEFTVIGLPNPGEYQAVKLRLDDGAFTGLDPDQLTHQRPVLDADGVPIKVGDTVWDIETGCGRTVRAVNDNETVEFDGYENRGWFGKFLTHAKPEPPDSRRAIVNEIGDEMAARIDLLVISGRWSDAD